QDFLFRGSLADLDPDVANLVRLETARQARTLIMIPSESTIPEAVREAVGSAFHNIYAEGYPSENMRHMDEEDILDYDTRMAEFRRNSDARYYKGTEYANIVESLARRRAAMIFSNEHASADDLYVNVQPLSGAPANNAVYTALINPGDTILSMDLIAGGHLSHGSPVNRSGKWFNIVSYAVDADTEVLDYEKIRALAIEHKPKIIIGGYSSYPIHPDWDKYRAIADEVGAYLLADVAHFAGMVATGAYPSPVGIADIVTFTTHKTMNGSRGACIITHRKDLSAKIDRGVFPGEQGGPHINNIAGLAVAFKFAQTEQFKELQRQTVINAQRLSDRLQARGIRIPHGGTDSHMLVVDLRAIKGEDGTPLSGDMAARILDLIGIVCNRQTIPGDTSALRPSGIRLGSPWLTQRGADVAMMDKIADIIADVLLACKPFSYTGKHQARAKINFEVFNQARLAVRDIVDSLGIDTDATVDGYPHFYYSDDAYPTGWNSFLVRGERAEAFLDIAATNDIQALETDNSITTNFLAPDGSVLASAVIEKVNDTDFHIHTNGDTGTLITWLRALSDGFVEFDLDDVYAKVPGPVIVSYIGETEKSFDDIDSSTAYATKPYFVGINGANYELAGDALPAFEWHEAEATGLKSVLWNVHQTLGAKMGEFAGYDMPLWYDKVMTEHLAVRNNAGIFDVTHMGVWDVKGRGAERFLDAITANDLQRLAVGDSHYTFFLDETGIPLDDLLIYRLGTEHFFVVVNASNNDKNWAWVNGVLNGTVRVSADLPQLRIPSTNVQLRDLRAESSGADQRVDIALQGPKSKNILLSLGGHADDLARVKNMPWAAITTATLGGFDLIISRTGYTGERIAYEVFPHPDDAPALFQKLVDLGAVPCGLAARDSLRIEAGLPLYGHELEGNLDMTPADAGMESYIKLYKPFFVGKKSFIARERKRDAQISRFRMDNKGARPAHQGDPIVDNRGRVIGVVTSCSIDSDGYQLGQAYIKIGNRSIGNKLAVFAGSSRAKAHDLSTIGLGDKAPIPEPISVLRRFPKR
ncbi:MAG: serine hydroxymethyltransferase, partial [Phototrophicaceae bacterium]